MSILGSNNGNSSGPIFQEFKKQASFFFKEKIKTARLAISDVTPAQLLTEEATNGNSWAPDTRTLKAISKAAFEVDDYSRILQILHNRLVKFDRMNWRTSYQALIVIEYLMTHGPESVAEEFQSDKNVIREIGCLQHIDEKGFNWGLAVRLKSEKITMLLEEGSLLKEERNRARKVSRGIEGFGSFSQRTSSAQGILSESPITKYERSKSEFIENSDGESMKTRIEQSNDENVSLVSKEEKVLFLDDSSYSQTIENIDIQAGLKENVAPKQQHATGGFDRKNLRGASTPLLDDENDECRPDIFVEEDHPFNDSTQLTSASLLSKDRTLEAF